jgi:hypothetical protein
MSERKFRVDGWEGEGEGEGEGEATPEYFLIDLQPFPGFFYLFA